MRHTRAESELTRARVLDAALAAFADRGVRSTTLEDVAALAGVTRGAVYWHFEDKAALVAEVIADLQWPLDIGADMTAYQAHPQPLRLLREQLWQRMERCIGDPAQWRTVQLVLRHGVRSELPADAMARVDRAMAETVTRLGRVMTIAYHRHQLRPGLRPVSVARCLHAVGVGLLSEYASQRMQGESKASPLCLDLFMVGACGDSLSL